MDTKQGTDLERRLAARLRPARVLGAEETWARIAPTIDIGGGRRRWGLLPALSTAVAVVLVITMASGVIFTFRETGTGGFGSQPVAATPTPPPPVAAIVSTSTIGVGASGSLLTGLQPVPPFAIFQPDSLPTGMQLIASAYNPAPSEPNQSAPVGAGSMFNGPGSDAALMQAAAQRSQQLLGDRNDVTLVLIYAVSADDQIELVQQSAAGKSLPAGEALTVHGLPATRTQRDGRTVINWIEAGTYLEFGVTSPTAERVQFASSLHQTALSAPTTLLATPAPGMPAVITVPASSANRRGAISVPQTDRQTITQQCGTWDPGFSIAPPQPPTTTVPFTTIGTPVDLQPIVCTARVISGLPEETSVGVTQLSWGQASEQLGVDQALGQSGDAAVLMVMLNFSNTGGTVVVLDAQTGAPIVLVQLLLAP